MYKCAVSILTQKTISKKISFSGIGIHTGEKVNLDLLPASPNTGIIFIRTDLKNNNTIYPNYSNVWTQHYVQLFQMNMEQKYLQ